MIKSRLKNMYSYFFSKCTGAVALLQTCAVAFHIRVYPDPIRHSDLSRSNPGIGSIETPFIFRVYRDPIKKSCQSRSHSVFGSIETPFITRVYRDRIRYSGLSKLEFVLGNNPELESKVWFRLVRISVAPLESCTTAQLRSWRYGEGAHCNLR